ncbi:MULTISPECIES: hypothetical protein [unclassified Moorena]|uniref:hypothetical protein n=1 Tax=unclassified Moorena TaxID=2683338 RepID=UPI0013FF5692|nr:MULTISPECIES: hypothetical protein [unclassified Moorena]NEO14339.1 hypothetical protein [Moorena sp. SIO3E8]NEQ00372.1 hypothetical protein [Moorena sp. SIO3F7]
MTVGHATGTHLKRIGCISLNLFDPVVRYGTDSPNTGYRENEGSPVPKAPYATVPCSLFPVPCSLP